MKLPSPRTLLALLLLFSPLLSSAEGPEKVVFDVLFDVEKSAGIDLPLPSTPPKTSETVVEGHNVFAVIEIPQKVRRNVTITGFVDCSYSVTVELDPSVRARIRCRVGDTVIVYPSSASAPGDISLGTPLLLPLPGGDRVVVEELSYGAIVSDSRGVQSRVVPAWKTTILDPRVDEEGRVFNLVLPASALDRLRELGSLRLSLLPLSE